MQEGTPPENSAPGWFARAVSAPCESRFVTVDGTPIHYLTWNAHETHKPGVLFAHGFRAHARWWSFIAPFLMSRFRVAAMDFGGMGDSGSRAEYSFDSFTHDMLGVIAHAGFDRPILVGHSFGGARVLRTCADHPGLISRAVIIDTHLHFGDKPPTMPELHPKKTYPTYQAARERFRLIPPQNRAAPYILDYVAHHSLKQVADGWTWKFDDGPHSRRHGNAAEVLARIDIPVSYIYGDASAIVSRAHAHEIVSHLKHGHGPIAIPESHHHVMLDQPLPLIATLRALLY
jgi:pimeloyl-ACP methyl ester carboxylesterase